MKFTEKYWTDIERVVAQITDIEGLFGRSFLLTGTNGMIVSSVADVLLWLNEKKGADMNLFFAARDENRLKQRFPYSKIGSDYQYLYFDAAKSISLDAQVDFIVNGASPADPSSFTRFPVETMMSSLNGVHTLLETAREGRTKRFLQISSSEVYGKKHDAAPYNEDEYGFVDVLNARACYPAAKRAADTLCVAYGSEYGLDTVIIRPGHIYGPSVTEADSRVSSLFIRLAAAGKDLMMKSPGRQMRSYCYTLDCASAILTVLLHGEPQTAYNISNRQSVVTIREMGEAFAEAGHVKLTIVDATEEEKKGYNLMENSSLDATRLENLGWKALFDMKDGARRTLEEY